MKSLLHHPVAITEQLWPDDMIPVVSICCLAYNHNNFIRECLNGFLIQVTTFPVEILIHDDASTDNTGKIIREYEAKYPQLFKPIYQTENQYSKGITVSRNFNFSRATGKYIALCEGDDYWTDPLKLEKQFSYLEANTSSPICFHPVYWLDQNTGNMTKTYYGAPGIKSFYTLDDLLEYSNFIPTASVLFKNYSSLKSPGWYSNCPIGDYPLHLITLCSSNSENIGFIDEPMAVYRRHSGGVHGGRSLAENRERLIETYILIGNNLGLNNRTSWRKGLAKWMHELIEAYRKDEDTTSHSTTVKISKKIILINGYRVGQPTLPVGIGYIAQALENAEISYDVCDVNIMSHDQIVEFIISKKPDYIGLGTMTFEVEKNYQLLQTIRSVLPNSIIVLGGPHAIAAEDEIFQECPAIDLVIQGEGEVSLVKLLNGEPFQTIPGLLARDSTNNGPARIPLAIESIAFPRYQKFDLHKYGDTMNIASSRGCVYKCTFCGAPKFLGNKWRAFSVERMIEEFEYWHAKGYKHFYFSDSLFALNKPRVVDFCKYIIDSAYNDVDFFADGARADHLTLEVMQYMKKANFLYLTFGVESVNDKTLDFFQKGETFDQIDNAISNADSLGFDISVYLIIGAPVESFEDALKSIYYPLKYKNIVNAIVSKLMPIKGTPYYKYALAHDLVANPNLCYPTHEVAGFNKRTNLNDPVEKIWDALTPEINKLAKFLTTRNEIKKNLMVNGVHDFDVVRLNTLTRQIVASLPGAIDNVPEKLIENRKYLPFKEHFLSVIIPTRNRAAMLYNTLESISLQTYQVKSFEVIVVDNGSTDSTAAVCKHFERRIPQLRRIYDSRPGLHNGRHTGMDAAAGNILVFADDDIEATPAWLEGIAESFFDPNVALVGGKILPKFESPPPEWVDALSGRTGSGWTLGWYSLLDFGDTAHEIPHEYVWGCNFSIRKDILKKVGGFHPDSFPQELIKYRGDGETAVSFAVRDMGLIAMYNPKASVYHVVTTKRLTEEYIYQRSFNQGISDSYANIRKKRSLSPTMEYSPPSNSIHDIVDRGMVDGFNYHQRMLIEENKLQEWVLRVDYLNENGVPQ